MTDLTEQWDKGKLPEGDYYIKRRNGLLLYDNIDSRGVWRNSIDEDIIEVLAPVPSYDEWKTAYECVVSENEEITTLKELLKRARGLMNCTKDWACTEATEEMITKINQALGEDK